MRIVLNQETWLFTENNVKHVKVWLNFAEPTNTTIQLTTYKVLAVVQPGNQLESCMESTEA